MLETFLPLTHLILCSTLSLGWNLRPIKFCHPEWGLTVTIKPPWGTYECKQLLKPQQRDRVAVHISDLHAVNISPFQIHKRCSFVGLADASPLHLSSTAQCLGGWREAAAELPVQHPIQSLFSQQQRSLWEAGVEVIFCGCYMAASSPSGSDVSQPLGSSSFATVIGVWSLLFPVAWSGLPREITASTLCQVLIPVKSVTWLQLTSVGPWFKQHHVIPIGFLHSLWSICALSLCMLIWLSHSWWKCVFINLQIAQQLCVYITSFEGHMYSHPCAINIYTVTTTYTQIPCTHTHACCGTIRKID